MSKIVKPLIFVVTLVVAFAIGYTLGPGKGQGVDNSDEIKRLQKQVAQKSKQVAALQQSLNALKKEQAALRKDLQNSKQQLGATSTAPASDAYGKAGTGDAAVGDLTFYSDLPKQPVTPEPLKANAAKTADAHAATAAKPTVNPVKIAKDAQAAQAAAKKADTSSKPGTSNKPIAAGAAKAPEVAKAATPPKAKPAHALPARYIPPGFNGATAAKTHATTSSKKAASYVVQLASYKSEAATATLRKNLAKLGFTADVKKATLKNGKTVYRVVVGPYHGYSRAKSAKSSLKAKTKLDGLIVKAG